MKVYKDDRGSHDLEVQVERLQIRVRELEEINEAHKKLNGELREELKNVRKALYKNTLISLPMVREAMQYLTPESTWK